jgi:hypothetical protein
MEPKRRGRQSAALVSSILLVGAVIGYASGVGVFMAGSKSNSVFQYVPAQSPPPVAPAGPPKSTPAGPGAKPLGPSE